MLPEYCSSICVVLSGLGSLQLFGSATRATLDFSVKNVVYDDNCKSLYFQMIYQSIISQFDALLLESLKKKLTQQCVTLTQQQRQFCRVHICADFLICFSLFCRVFMFFAILIPFDIIESNFAPAQ